MYYRYEGRRNSSSEWIGIFQIFTPDQRRKWRCLADPKWYEEHPDEDSKAWFTEHGYNKWKDKMQETIDDYMNWYAPRGVETRLITAESLDNIVFKGKTQVIQKI